MSEHESLLIEREGGIVTFVTNDAPINRMTFEYMDALEQGINEAAADPDVRVLVFTAAGDRNFSVGMDLKQLQTGSKARGGPEAVFDQRLRVLSTIENMAKPSIATLFGYCLGGGLELPLACHFRLAAEEGAKIGLPELDLGSVPAWGGTARLTRCVGRDTALDMILRAKKIDGPEALRIGLVQEVHPLAQLKSWARAARPSKRRWPRSGRPCCAAAPPRTRSRACAPSSRSGDLSSPASSPLGRRASRSL
jgi:enoyl-CoA hydratase